MLWPTNLVCKRRCCVGFVANGLNNPWELKTRSQTRNPSLVFSPAVCCAEYAGKANLSKCHQDKDEWIRARRATVDSARLQASCTPRGRLHAARPPKPNRACMYVHEHPIEKTSNPLKRDFAVHIHIHATVF